MGKDFLILKKFNSIVILGYIFVLIIFGVILISPKVYAQDSDSFITSISVQMEEYIFLEKSDYNKTSVEINFPGTSCNITDIEVNMTNIHVENRTHVVDGGDAVFGILAPNGGVDLVGVEIILDSPMSVSSVEIFGYYSYEVLPGSDQIYVQIQGYNTSTNLPNSTIYGSSTLLNIDTEPGWYNQIFPAPIYLTTGRYYLVINGSQASSSEYTYYWRYGNVSTIKSVYYTTEWDITPVHCFFCYKINQDYQSFTASEIDMFTYINGTQYEIINGSEYASGYLKVNNLYYHQMSQNYSLDIITSLQQDVYFDYSYQIYVQRKLTANGKLNISYGYDNEWKIDPEFAKVGTNYSIKFSYPSNWDNIVVLRNNSDITENLTLFTNYVIIPDEFINENDTWEIKANSPALNGFIEVPKDIYESQENITIQIELPVSQGYLTTKLVSTSNQVLYSHSQNFSQSNVVIIIPIAANIVEGLYEIQTYWYGNNQAGIQKQSVYIKNPSVLNQFSLLLTIFIAILGSFTIAVSTYSYIKYKQNKVIKEDHDSKLSSAKIDTERSHRSLLLNLYKDHYNLKHIIVNEKDTGINLYYQCFSFEELNHILVSGFLEAIQSFGKTIFHRKDQSVYMKIEFQGSILILLEYYNFKICFVFDDEPSIEFIKTLKELSNEIESEFSELIEHHNNDLTKFKGIRKIINDYLLTPLMYPLKVTIPSTDMVNQDEEKIIKEILENMKSCKRSHFFVQDLILLEDFDEKKAECILDFIKRKIINPVFLNLNIV